MIDAALTDLIVKKTLRRNSRSAVRVNNERPPQRKEEVTEMKTKKRTTKSTLPLQQLSNERGIRAGASSGKTRGKNRSILRESRCKAGRSPSLTADDRSTEWNSLNVNLTLSDTTVWAILVGALQDPISRRRALPTRSSWMRIPKMTMMMIKRSRLVTLATTSRKKATGGGSLCIPLLTHLDLSLQVALNTNQRRKDHQKTKGRSVAEKEEGMSVVAETMIVMKMIKGRRKEVKPRPSMLDEVPSETTTQPPWKSHNGASQTNHCHARARVLRMLTEDDSINTSGASI